MATHQRRPAAEVVTLMVAILVLALPAASTAQFVQSLLANCEATDRAFGRPVSAVFCVTGDLSPGCCGRVKLMALEAGDCICGAIKDIAAKNIDLNKLCRTTGLEDPCRAKEEREEQLSKLDPCARMFQRLAANEISKINSEDATACALKLNTCPADCNKQQR